MSLTSPDRTPTADLPAGWKQATQQILDDGHDPVECPACHQPGYATDEGDERGELVRHLGRWFLCRVPAGMPPGRNLAVPVESEVAS